MPTLRVSDAEAIAELPSIGAVAPAYPQGAQLVYGPNNWSTMMIGTTPEYLEVRDWSIATGYAFTVADVRAAARVALLGRTVAENLFGDQDPIGKTIRIKQSPFLVAGVLPPRVRVWTGAIRMTRS